MQRRSRGTDGTLLASLPWSLAAMALALAPHLPYLVPWIPIMFVGCAAYRWNIERRRGKLPPPSVRIALACVGFFGVMAQYGSVNGIGPGTALLAVMASLKLLETRRRRDQFVLMFIAIFLVMASLLREQYLWSLPYLMVSVWLIMTAWLRLSASAEVSARESALTAGRLIAYALPIMLVMWVLFPRIATPFWSIPTSSDSATSGLSDQMSPGDISNLSLSDAVAFRVQFESTPPPPEQRYWRGLVLQRFNGRTWSALEPSFTTAGLEHIKVAGDAINYQVTLEPTKQRWIFALEIPTQWSLGDITIGAQQQLVRQKPIDSRLVYTASSHTNYVTDIDLSERGQNYYQNLPTSGNSKTVAFARQLREEFVDDRELVNATLAYFRNEEFYYTLRPPALGNNPVDRFLFETRRGFCEHYASAFTVIMRAAGIPARIVLGYQGGEINPLGNYLIVRQSDAHAWSEIWLRDQGWVRVDPTAAVAPERIESGISASRFSDIGRAWGLTAPSQLLYELGLAWDAINSRWNEWILGYGPENQSSFLQWLGMTDPDWRKMMLTLVAVVTLLVVAVSGFMMLRYRLPRRDDAAILYEQFVRIMGLAPIVGEAPFDYQARLSMERQTVSPLAGEFIEVYLQTRYGTPKDRQLTQLRTLLVEIAKKP